LVTGVWFPYAIPYYVVRIAEMRPALIVLAAVVAIGILVWKKPRHWALWVAGVVVGAIVLIALARASSCLRYFPECRRPRSPLAPLFAVFVWMC
jgi:hypothetical protein